MQGLASLLHSALTLSLLASSPQRLQLPSILASRQLASSQSSDCFIGSIVEVVASLLLGFSYPTHTHCRLICINKTTQRGNTRRSLQCAVRDPAISGSGSGSLGAAACRQTSAALPQHQATTSTTTISTTTTTTTTSTTQPRVDRLQLLFHNINHSVTTNSQHSSHLISYQRVLSSYRSYSSQLILTLPCKPAQEGPAGP